MNYIQLLVTTNGLNFAHTPFTKTESRKLLKHTLLKKKNKIYTRKRNKPNQKSIFITLAPPEEIQFNTGKL